MKVLLSILFILTGIYSCFFIEAEQIPFYKNYFQSWVLTLLISHLIPSFYLIIGFLLFITRLNKIILYVSSLSIFFFLIEIFLHNFFGYDINIICLLVTLLFVIIFTFLNFKKINTELFLIKNVFLKKSVTLIFILLSETNPKRVGSKVKVIIKDVISPKVIIHPKSIIGLIPLKTRDKKAHTVVKTV